MDIANSETIEKIDSFVIFNIIEKKNRYLHIKSFLDKEVLKLSKEVA